MSKLVLKLNSSDSSANATKLIAFGPHASLSEFLSNLGQLAKANCTVQILNEDEAYASGTITMSFADQTAGDTIQVGSILLEADTDFDIGLTDDESAANLAAAINAASSGLLHATAADEVVTVTATIAGPMGNEVAIILDQAAAGMTAAASLSGGSNDTAPAVSYKKSK